MEKKLWTVVWTKEGRKKFDVPKSDHGLIPIEDDKYSVSVNVSKSKIGRPKMRWANVYPVFDTKEAAEAYREGNTDWESVSLPLK